MSKAYNPLVLFNDYAPSTLSKSTSSLSASTITKTGTGHDYRENLSRPDADPSLPRSHCVQEQQQQQQQNSQSQPRRETDMDVDTDIDMNTTKSSQGINASKATTLSPLNVSIANNKHYRSMSSSSSTDSPTSVHGMVSPPSSYSSNSSNMEHLAKTLSPARIDIHRNKVQRMLQQNSLLWWELVRYTRNLERKEKEQEMEKEQLLQSSSPSPSKSKAEHYYHHHHHHHHHASLPPLHTHQTLTASKSPPSLKNKPKSDDRQSYEYQELSHQSIDYAFLAGAKPVPEDSYPRQVFVARSAHASPPIREDREGDSLDRFYPEDQLMRYRHQPHPQGAYRGRSPGSRSPSPVRRTLEPTLGHRSSSSSLRQSPTHYSTDRRSPEGQPPYPNYQPPARPHPTYPRQNQNQGSQHHHYDHPPHRPLAPEEHPYNVPHHSRQEAGPRADPAHTTSMPSIKRQSPMESGPYSLLPSPLTSASRHSSGPSSTESSPRPTQAPPQYHQPQHYQPSMPRPQPHYPSQHPRSNSHPNPRHDSSSSPHSNSLGSSHQKTEPTGRPVTMEISLRTHAPGPIPNMSGSNTLPSMETEPSSLAGGDAQSNMDPNRKRRGNLPKSVTSVLKNWLVQNAIHPYPTEDEKIKLAEATHLSLNQISNWFINARRRILQPILVEAAAAAVAGTDAPMENVLIVRKGKGSRMQVEMEASTHSNSGGSNIAPTSSSTASSPSMPQHPHPHHRSISPGQDA
ncbi:hypothetical protein BGZ93_009437 [Podila epicladia]|nr:hypothetical protein BGZ93_009437 [Podila epicladia]